jgi:hypothetical protein
MMTLEKIDQVREGVQNRVEWTHTYKRSANGKRERNGGGSVIK